MDGWITIGTKLDTKGFEKQIQKLEDDLDTLEQEYEALSKAKPYDRQKEDLMELSSKIEKTKNQIISLRKQQNDINTKGFKEFNDSLGNAIKRIGKMALAVFGIRTAFNAVRNAINTISQNDEQLRADIDYIKGVLAYTLEPIVRRIVDLIKQMMIYIGYIIKQWTGKDIFGDASKKLKKANGTAQKLSKTLAGFDEMNVVSGGDSGASGVSSSFDLSAPEDFDPPKWLVWIADNKEIILGALTGIALALLAIKLANPVSWIELAIVAVTTLVGVIIKYWDEIKAALEPAAQWLWDNVLSPAWEFIKDIGETIWSYIKYGFSVIKGIFTTLIEILKSPFVILKETVTGVFNGIKTIVKGVFDVIKGLFTGDWKRVMDGFKSIFKGVFNTLWSIAKAPLNLIIDGINALIKGANKIQFDVPDWVPVIGGKKLGFNLKTIPRLAKGGIVNMPSRGVPVGGAIAGERGQEGVIPLTDSQQMALLGEAIGKYITINATVVNSMNGRVLSREIQKIQNQGNFAMNR